MKKHSSVKSEHVQILKRWVDYLRSQAESKEKLNLAISSFLNDVKSNDDQLNEIREIIKDIFTKYDGLKMLSLSGIVKEQGPISSITQRLKENILPKYIEPHDARQIIRQLFDHNRDYQWLQHITKANWNLLIEVMDLKALVAEQRVNSGILAAIQLLSSQISAVGNEDAVLRKLPDLEITESPFYAQFQHLSNLIASTKDQLTLSLNLSSYKQLILGCKELLLELRARRQEIGTSINLIYATRNLGHLITRLNKLLAIAAPTTSEDFVLVVRNLFIDIVQGENNKGNIFFGLKENIEILAFEIVEHAAQHGGKYIASNASEYFKYFKSAAVGGFIIAIFAFFKVVISGWQISPLGEGLLNSLNYALCFVIVYLLGGIIATKQPAMTASTIARCMDRSDDGTIDDLQGLKNLIIKTSRSQFVSFLGNLSLAFPVAVLISSILIPNLITGSKANMLLFDGHPTATPSILFAAIAGIFLSLAGLISGYVDNKVIFNRFKERFVAHPLLSKWSVKKRNKLAQYLNKRLGALSGNIALGFFLGMSGSFGYFTGLPLDIRHVAFSSANLGMGLGSTGWNIEINTLLILCMGVLIIGLVNFLVSFSITLMIALKSRKVTFQQTGTLLYMLLFRLVKTPLDFVMPPEVWNWSRNRSIFTFFTKLSKN